MFRFLSTAFALACAVNAQQTSFKPETGTRSLWIPFQTIDGIPLASVASNDSSANVTAYVISCPKASPSCAIAPNLTLTEGPSTVRYKTSNSAGVATLGCAMSGTTYALCSQAAEGGGNVVKGSTSTLSPSQISYQAVDITSTNNNTATMPVTVTVTANRTSSSTSSTMSSTAGATVTSGPWAMGGALGAGIVALAAL